MVTVSKGRRVTGFLKSPLQSTAKFPRKIPNNSDYLTCRAWIAALNFTTWVAQCYSLPAFSAIESHPTLLQNATVSEKKRMVAFDLMTSEVDTHNIKILFKQTSQKKTNMRLKVEEDRARNWRLFPDQAEK